MEQEQDEQDDKESETNLQEALSDKTKAVKLVIDKWFVDKGFGFGKVPTGETVFIHASVVHGGEVLMVGTDAWVQVVNDEARADGGYRARNAWGRNAWKEEKDGEKANRVAQQVRRAAALTAELAGQSEKKVAACDRDEPTEHITAPNMGAGGSHHQAEMMQHSLFASPLLPTGKGFFNLAGFRGGRSRSTTRAQEVTPTARCDVGSIIGTRFFFPANATKSPWPQTTHYGAGFRPWKQRSKVGGGVHCWSRWITIWGGHVYEQV